MLDFVAAGDVMLDVIVQAVAPNERVHASATVRAGGSAVNAARVAASLGARVAVVGSVGDDPAGRAIADDLQRAGIETFLTVHANVATGTTVYTGTAVAADRGANAHVEIAELPEARITLISGYLGEQAVATALAAASGFRAVDLQGALADAPGADVVLGPNIDVEALAQKHDVACTTRGVDGAIAIRGNERAEARPPRTRTGVLPGAGDAFAAAFLLALAAGAALDEALQRGCAAGAAS